MNEQPEYLGFAMVDPEQGSVVHIFDLDNEGVKKYGPYKLSFHNEANLPPDEADILLLSFRDGTMPITLAEFVDRTNSGESWSNEQYNLFTQVDQIGSTYFVNSSTQRKMVMHDVLERDGSNFFIDMFEQCIDCLERVNGNKTAKRSKKSTKADKLFDKYLPDIASDLPDQGMYELYRDIIIDMINEAYDTTDITTVNFIVDKERELTKKRIASAKRPLLILKEMQKKTRDAVKKRNKKG
jgi:hypothetical protein